MAAVDSTRNVIPVMTQQLGGQQMQSVFVQAAPGQGIPAGYRLVSGPVVMQGVQNAPQQQPLHVVPRATYVAAQPQYVRLPVHPQQQQQQQYQVVAVQAGRQVLQAIPANGGPPQQIIVQGALPQGQVYAQQVIVQQPQHMQQQHIEQYPHVQYVTVQHDGQGGQAYHAPQHQKSSQPPTPQTPPQVMHVPQALPAMAHEVALRESPPASVSSRPSTIPVEQHRGNSHAQPVPCNTPSSTGVQNQHQHAAPSKTPSVPTARPREEARDISLTKFIEYNGLTSGARWASEQVPRPAVQLKVNGARNQIQVSEGNSKALNTQPLPNAAIPADASAKAKLSQGNATRIMPVPDNTKAMPQEPVKLMRHTHQAKKLEHSDLTFKHEAPSSDTSSPRGLPTQHANDWGSHANGGSDNESNPQSNSSHSCFSTGTAKTLASTTPGDMLDFDIMNQPKTSFFDNWKLGALSPDLGPVEDDFDPEDLLKLLDD